MNIARIAVEAGNIPNITDKSYCLEIYCCGCKHGCRDCHNKGLWNFEAGDHMALSDIMEEIAKKRKFAEYVLFLGGDFGYFPAELAILSAFSHKMGYKTIFYTGFELQDFDKSVLKDIDYILCGKYDEKDPAKINKIRRLNCGEY